MLSRLLELFGNKSARQARTHGPKRRRLAIESLERRELMAIDASFAAPSSFELRGTDLYIEGELSLADVRKFARSGEHVAYLQNNDLYLDGRRLEGATEDFAWDTQGDLHRLRVDHVLEQLMDSPEPMVVGADAGGGPHVRVLDAVTRAEQFSFYAYHPEFSGGVRVAMGDVNGDGQQDIITAPGPGNGPQIRVFDGASAESSPRVIQEFMAYFPQFTCGVSVAAADVNGDGMDDIITGAGAGGGPHVKVFSGRDGSVLQSFYAYHPLFSGGVQVAAGDVDADGRADVITGAGAGGGPHVRVFSGRTGAELFGFYAYHPMFSGGVYVAAGDTDGDGRADILTGPGAGGGPHVRVVSGANQAELHSFYAYHPMFGGGVRVGVGDIDGDGRADLITGPGPGGGPHVRGFSGLDRTEASSFYAYDPAFGGGVTVGGANSTSDSEWQTIRGDVAAFRIGSDGRVHILDTNQLLSVGRDTSPTELQPWYSRIESIEVADNGRVHALTTDSELISELNWVGEPGIFTTVAREVEAFAVIAGAPLRALQYDGTLLTETTPGTLQGWEFGAAVESLAVTPVGLSILYRDGYLMAENVRSAANVASMMVDRTGHVIAHYRTGGLVRYRVNGTAEFLAQSATKFSLVNDRLYVLHSPDSMWDGALTVDGVELVADVAEFAADESGRVVVLTSQGVLRRDEGSGFEDLARNISRFALLDDGRVLARDGNGILFTYVPGMSGWREMRANVREFAVEGSTVYVLSTDGQLTSSDSATPITERRVDSFLANPAGGIMYQIGTELWSWHNGLNVLIDEAVASYQVGSTSVTGFDFYRGAVGVRQLQQPNIIPYDGNRLYVSFDGVRFSRNDLLRLSDTAWNDRTGEWNSAWSGLDRLDRSQNGVSTFAFNIQGYDRNALIRDILQKLREDVQPFGVEVVPVGPDFHPSRQYWGTNTVYVGSNPMDHYENLVGLACTIDVEEYMVPVFNVNRSDIAFVWGKPGDGWSRGSAATIAQNYANVILHEAGHIWGLHHVSAPQSSNEVMGEYLSGVDARFVDAGYASSDPAISRSQNSVKVLEFAFR